MMSRDQHDTPERELWQAYRSTMYGKAYTKASFDEQDIAAWLDGTASPELVAEIETAMLHDDLFCELLAELRAILLPQATLPVPTSLPATIEHRLQSEQTIWFPMLLKAIAALAIITASASGYWLGTKQSPQQTPSQSILILELMVPSENLGVGDDYFDYSLDLSHTGGMR